MNNTILDLNRKLNALSVFRGILETPIVSNLQKLLYAIENSSLDEQLWSYGAFSKALYEDGGNLSKFVQRFVMEDDNFIIQNKLNNISNSKSICDCLNEELLVLSQLAVLTTPQIISHIDYDKFLPRWDISPVDLPNEYENMLNSLSTKGFGIFAKHNTFKVDNGHLIPVVNFDSQSLDSLYGYTRERDQVLENTKALAQGKVASNVLLYGDAGTGKSSTIKACASAYFHEGIRLIQFTKAQLKEIPLIVEALAANPLKFIFYIDDLSFTADDDSYCDFKGILEGSITGKSNNIVIYATSNRRHLIQETASQRIGDDLHLNDTLQETMSLAARFGLTITFSKPEKDLYLNIVSGLAKEYGITTDEAELFKKAEAFAIRSNGRSPRTAKQFIQLAGIGLK